MKSHPSLKDSFPETSALYVHVPFCRHRCGYCDFSLVANRNELQMQYLKSIEIELNRRVTTSQPALKTLFLGGGTPTQLTETHFQTLIEIISNRWHITAETEFSVEANPQDLTKTKLECLKAAGVNRVSLGVQSFDNAVLKTLERDHRAAELPEILSTAREQIGNLSLDLIFAVPGQSCESWKQTLEMAVSIQPHHLSTYGLTFEKGTSFWTRREKGTLLQSPDQLEADMYTLAQNMLLTSGFDQYEVSNFALPGFECLHNMGYWTGKSFAAVGPGAASFDGAVRMTNHRSLFTWMKRLHSGESAVQDVDQLTSEERAREQMVIGLRLRNGINRNEFFERTGYDLNILGGEPLEKLVRNDMLEWDEQQLRLRMTANGLMFADSITVELI